MKKKRIPVLRLVFAGVVFLCSSCATGPKVEEKIPLKYPVVLVHGIVFSDRSRVLPSWGRIPETLEKAGARVYFGNTDAWGKYETNALILKETIEKILAETKEEKVNIIAHSKGGIDARYLIWKHNFGDKVASLTTVCTPHRGAVLADIILDQEFIHTDTTRRALEIYGRLCGDIHPDLLDVGNYLTTKKMEEFNNEVIMDRRVYFQSLYSSMRNAFDDRLLFYSYREIYKVVGENDGLVSEASARWGRNPVKIAEGLSHTEIIDLKRRKISGVDVPALYVGIIRDLYGRGF